MVKDKIININDYLKNFIGKFPPDIVGLFSKKLYFNTSLNDLQHLHHYISIDTGDVGIEFKETLSPNIYSSKYSDGIFLIQDINKIIDIFFYSDIESDNLDEEHIEQFIYFMIITPDHEFREFMAYFLTKYKVF